MTTTNRVLKAALILKGYSVKTFSEVVGTTPQHMTAVITNRSNPSRPLKRLMAITLGTTVEDLFANASDFCLVRKE